ncbi:GtrA family protein [Cereibacter sphaeroides]|uniref:GtrA family protein n=1 Tax=Cereibacter sphaeroides TaxID=1063 RepID=UPI001F38830A|nr:GtrA family protein [Cereibacter sphaeroides]MCE6957684.1 GtrA family protein [Cereibacter sphaeroides]MCE6967069.1 GtrA family protein [Cereibacter sphaeroides]MCE6971449.1 GtrA family protein [Cereibacter sphaeroides]
MRFGPTSRYLEVARFVVVGGIATLTHFTALTAAVEYGGISPTLANGIAFLCAVCVTLTGQSFWVFQGHGRLTLTKATRFACSLAMGFLLNLAIMGMSIRIFMLDYRIGFLASVVIVTCVSFTVNKMWVFGKVS